MSLFRSDFQIIILYFTAFTLFHWRTKHAYGFIPSQSYLNKGWKPQKDTNLPRNIITITEKILSSHSPQGTTLNMSELLIRLKPSEVTNEIKDPVEPTALNQAKAILSEIRPNNSKHVVPSNLVEVAKRLGDIPGEATSYIKSKEECKAAFDLLNDEERNALVNIHHRVKVFAEAQRGSIQDMEVPIPGGVAGHSVSPCRVAGCYAPGGRYPLPSSVIMTAVTARAAGCEIVVLASPRPAPITLAAAYISNADLFLCVGGAQAGKFTLILTDLSMAKY